MTSKTFASEFLLLRRVEKIFERYCREGKRPSREESKSWLISLGWKEHPAENLLQRWGYTV